MNLKNAISHAFPEGIEYEDAAILCLKLYCSLDGVPEDLHPECTKDNIASSFAQLYSEGKIIGSAAGAVVYGANFHSCHDKGHWFEVIASIFKKGIGYDHVRAQGLISKIVG